MLTVKLHANICVYHVVFLRVFYSFSKNILVTSNSKTQAQK